MNILYVVLIFLTYHFKPNSDTKQPWVGGLWVGAWVGGWLEFDYIQGVSKKGKNVCLFNISKTNKQISKPLFSENWDPYVNFKYRTNFVLFSGAEKFTKQNVVVVDKYIFILTLSCPHITRVVLWWTDGLLTGPIITSEPLRGPKLAQPVSQGVSGPLSGQSGHLKATLRQWGPLQVIINMYLSNS